MNRWQSIACTAVAALVVGGCAGYLTAQAQRPDDGREAQEWAQETGIITGGRWEERPTRSQVARMLYRYHQHITERTAGANHQHTAGELPADGINTTTTAAGGQSVTTTTTAAAVTQAHGERVPRGETIVVRLEWAGTGWRPEWDRLEVVAIPRDWRGYAPRSSVDVSGWVDPEPGDYLYITHGDDPGCSTRAEGQDCRVEVDYSRVGEPEPVGERVPKGETIVIRLKRVEAWDGYGFEVVAIPRNWEGGRPSIGGAQALRPRDRVFFSSPIQCESRAEGQDCRVEVDYDWIERGAVAVVLDAIREERRRVSIGTSSRSGWVYRVRSVPPVNIRGEQQFSLHGGRDGKRWDDSHSVSVSGTVGSSTPQPGDELWGPFTPLCSPRGDASLCELRIYNPDGTLWKFDRCRSISGNGVCIGGRGW